MGAQTSHRSRGGFTLIELMVVIALVAIILAIAAPSFRSMIEMQRLRSITSQLVTDFQFARSEAVARRALVGVAFKSNAAMTCYTVYSTPPLQQPCNCLDGPGAACAAPMVEVRTVQVPRSLSVMVAPVAGDQEFVFNPNTGGIMSIPQDTAPDPIESFKVETYIDAARKLQTVLNRAGRPQVCKPAGSTMTEASCP